MRHRILTVAIVLTLLAVGLAPSPARAQPGELANRHWGPPIGLTQADTLRVVFVLGQPRVLLPGGAKSTCDVEVLVEIIDPSRHGVDSGVVGSACGLFVREVDAARAREVDVIVQAEQIPDMPADAATGEAEGCPACGHSLGADDSWSFTARADTDAPTVISRAPAPGATGIALDGTISAIFSEALNPATVSSTSVLVSGHTGTISYDGATYSVTFTP